MNQELYHKVLRVVKTIAENLYSKRIVLEGETSWVNKTKGLFSKGSRFTSLDGSFYNGELGIAYFFLYTARSLNEPDYYSLAWQIYKDHRDDFIFEIEHDLEKESFDRYKIVADTSGLNYPLCLLGFVDHADTLYPEKNLWDEELADIFLRWLDNHMSQQLAPDFFFGLAGSICTLLNIYERKKDPRFLDIAIICADKLISDAHEKDDFLYWLSDNENDGKKVSYSLESFGLGNTGIAYALSRIYRQTLNLKYLTAIKKAMACEHCNVIPETILDEEKIFSESEFNDSWFNGSSGKKWGALLVNYFTSEVMAENTIFYEKENLVNTLGHTFSLNFGDTGIIEVIKLYAKISNDRGLDEEMDIYLEKNIDEYLHTGKFKFGKENPLMGFLGLFDGEAGIGYQLLRFAQWEHIPSLLALESPMRNILPLHEKL